MFGPGRFRVGCFLDGGVPPTLQDSFVDVLNAVGDTFEVRLLHGKNRGLQIMSCTMFKTPQDA